MIRNKLNIGARGLTSALTIIQSSSCSPGSASIIYSQCWICPQALGYWTWAAVMASQPFMLPSLGLKSSASTGRNSGSTIIHCDCGWLARTLMLCRLRMNHLILFGAGSRSTTRATRQRDSRDARVAQVLRDFRAEPVPSGVIPLRLVQERGALVITLDQTVRAVDIR